MHSVGIHTFLYCHRAIIIAIIKINYRLLLVLYKQCHVFAIYIHVL